MSRIFSSAGVAVILLAHSGYTVLAGESQANLDAYCENVHGHGAFKNIDRRDNGFLCTIGMKPGPGMTHHKMQPSDACAVQFNTRTFRREGDTIFCTNINDKAKNQDPQKVDLAEHCVSQYGTDAEVTRNNATGAPMCTVRTDGGLGLRHHIVDVSGLCPSGTSPGPVTGSHLNCIGGGASLAAANPTQSTEASNETAGRQTGKSQGSDAGSPYSGSAVTGETWRGIEGKASFYPGMDLRLERTESELKAFVSDRHVRDCPDDKFPLNGFVPGQDCKSERLGIAAGKLVLVGTISGAELSGKTRLTMTNNPMPFPICDQKWKQLDDNPSDWIDFKAKISGDTVVLKMDPEQSRALTLEVKPGKFDCARVPFITEEQRPPPPAPSVTLDEDSPENSNKVPIMEFAHSIRFQRLQEGPSVTDISIVKADSPFANVDRIAPGQALRLKVLIDRPAAGHEVATTARSSKGELQLTATCGTSLVNDPTVCLTPVFKTKSK